MPTFAKRDDVAHSKENINGVVYVCSGFCHKTNKLQSQVEQGGFKLFISVSRVPLGNKLDRRIALQVSHIMDSSIFSRVLSFHGVAKPFNRLHGPSTQKTSIFGSILVCLRTVYQLQLLSRKIVFKYEYKLKVYKFYNTGTSDITLEHYKV